MNQITKYDVLPFDDENPTELNTVITKTIQSRFKSVWDQFQHTSSISSLFLFLLVLDILTVTGKALPWCFTSILLGCRGVNWISISGLGNLLVCPFSVDTSEESRTVSEWSCSKVVWFKRGKSYYRNISKIILHSNWRNAAFEKTPFNSYWHMENFL